MRVESKGNISIIKFNITINLKTMKSAFIVFTILTFAKFATLGTRGKTFTILL